MHKVVTGGGYRGATFLGFSGSFKVLEARRKAVIPLCPAATWTTQAPHLQPLQPIKLRARERAAVGGFGAVGGHGDAPYAEPVSALPEHHAHHTLHLLPLLQLFSIYLPIISLDIFTCKKSQDKELLTNL